MFENFLERDEQGGVHANLTSVEELPDPVLLVMDHEENGTFVRCVNTATLGGSANGHPSSIFVSSRLIRGEPRRRP